MTGWVWLISNINGLPHRVPDNEAAIAPLVARGFEVTNIPDVLNSDDEEFQVALAEWHAAKNAEELKGKALDDALDKAGLSKAGSADEKRQRLAENQAASTTSESGDQPEGNE